MPTIDVQGSYDTSHPAGYAGMVASAVPSTRLSGFAEGADIAFGLVVGQGTADRDVVVGPGSAYRGITLADKSRSNDTYDASEAVAYMTKGEVYVVASTAVTVGDAVTYDATGAVGAALANTIDNARFKTAANAGDLVVVNLS